ncbi:1125_t:CDS:2, partial [Gigaspora margarita]
MDTDIQLTEKQEQVVTTVAIGAVLAFMFPPIGLAISAVNGGVGRSQAPQSISQKV